MKLLARREDRGSQRIGLLGVPDQVATLGEQCECGVAARFVHRERAGDLGEPEELLRAVRQQFEDLDRPLDGWHLTSHVVILPSSEPLAGGPLVLFANGDR